MAKTATKTPDHALELQRLRTAIRVLLRYIDANMNDNEGASFIADKLEAILNDR